ncbi:MAG: phosphoenolpyruvate synthase [Gemmatimonadota bacterium]
MPPETKVSSDRTYIRWFDTLTADDVALVGGKNASLGEMIQGLAGRGVRVPPGFAVTTAAYEHWVDEKGLRAQIRSILEDVDTNDTAELATKGRRVRDLILEHPLTPAIADEIMAGYELLAERFGTDPDVAVRSSATTEDLAEASFAGQQETFLNVRGGSDLVAAVHRCYASLFTNRAISYRVHQGFDFMDVSISVGVQKMVRAEKGASGVIFTIDTESGFRNVVLITGAYGLGDPIVRGEISPDEWYVFKPTLEQGYPAILRRRIGDKHEKLIYTSGRSRTKKVPVPKQDRRRLCLGDDEVLELARWSLEIEKHYSERAGKALPMDIEWVKDGETEQLYIVQARPETVHAQRAGKYLETYELLERGQPIVEGAAVGEKIGAGPVRVLQGPQEIDRFREGDVLVTETTDPDWEPIMKKACAIVTERGGRTSHAAIVSRELGVPCIVGASGAEARLALEEEVTVCCAEGQIGRVYRGLLEFKKTELSLENLPETETQIMMNVGNPDVAFRLASLPNDGVGLAREEFIIASEIGVHPLALLEFDQLREGNTKNLIARKTRGFSDKVQYYEQKLSEGIAMIGAAFHPNDVIVRFSDFKSNEYKDLLGGEFFEPEEENPMLGWRGASRYYGDRYGEAFKLECQAIKIVRDEIGLTNVKVMIPFCRTVQEGKRVLEVMDQAGLPRGHNGLEVYMMVEIPSNVIMIEEFAEIFDGFSIGSNDLTQLVLGLDRDSEIVAYLFDEQNEAVLRMIKSAIEGAKRCGRKIGICGQAPSDHPGFARFLVDCGIDSMSLNPDSVVRTIEIVAQAEETARREAAAEAAASALD